jgi:hypothetical protein
MAHVPNAPFMADTCGWRGRAIRATGTTRRNHALHQTRRWIQDERLERAFHGRGAPQVRAGRCAPGPHHSSRLEEVFQGTRSYIAKAPPLAQSRAKAGTMPSSSVMITPSVMAAVVKAPGTVTDGPSFAGSLKYISTITRR